MERAADITSTVRELAILALRSVLPFTVICLFVSSPTSGLAEGHHQRRKHEQLPAPVEEVLLVDSFGAVLQCNATDSRASILTKGGLLVRPYAIAALGDGQIVVSDTGLGALVRIDCASSEQSILAQSRELGVPYGIAVDAAGYIWVANGQEIVRVSPQGGRVKTITSGHLLQAPLGVALGEDGELFVADAAGRIVRVNSKTGQQHLVASGGDLINPVGIVFNQGDLLVTEMGGRKVLRISVDTGKQTVLAAAGWLTTPIGIALSASGSLLIGDPDANNLSGAIIDIDPATGTQRLIMSGTGDFMNPRGVLVIPMTPQPSSQRSLLAAH